MGGPLCAEAIDAVASVSDCLRLPVLRGAEVRGGHSGLGAAVRWASSSVDGRGCAPGEFRLVEAVDDAATVDSAAASGAVALAAPRLGSGATEAAARLALPLVQLAAQPRPEVVAAELLDYVIAALDTTLASLRRVSARLSAAACDDLRVESIAEALAGATGGPVLVEDADFRMLCAVGDGEIDPNRAETIRAGGTPLRFRGTLAMRRFYATLGRGAAPQQLPPDPSIGIHLPRLVAPVHAAAELLGYVTLIVPSATAQRRLCAVALEQAANLLALAIVHQRAVELAGRLESSHVLLDLIDGQAPAELVAARAGRLGLDLQMSASLALVALTAAARPEGALHRALSLLPPRRGALCDVVGGRLVMALTGDDREAHLRVVESIRQAVESPLAVVSRSAPLADLAQAHAETRRALEMALRSGRTGTVDGAHLGIIGVLLAGTADGALDRFAAARLAALADHDRREGTDLCGSVAVFLEAGGLRPAARRLGIHANSLAYRLTRAESIGGFNLASADDRLELALALRCRRLLGA